VGSDGNGTPEPAASGWSRARHFAEHALVGLLVGALWLTALGAAVIAVFYGIASGVPRSLPIGLTVLFGPAVAAVTGTVLVYAKWRLRWLWLPLSAALATAIPWVLLPYSFEAHWPAAAPVTASRHCPRPIDFGKQIVFTLTPEDTGYAGGGGIPKDFRPVSATRCTAEADGTAVSSLTGQPSVRVHEETSSGPFDALQAALAEPAEVRRGRKLCAVAGRHPSPGYLVLTDAGGRSLLVGFPMDYCNVPYQRAVAAFEALPWQTVGDTTFP
jgi:hypothetical protein